MIIMDFEVFKYDWVLCYIDTKNIKTDVLTHDMVRVIYNDRHKLLQLYEMYKNDVWIGYNISNYDRHILNAIIMGLDKSLLWEYSNAIIENGAYNASVKHSVTQLPLLVNDPCQDNFRMLSLKQIEGYMGESIEECKVSFKITRQLTLGEMKSVISYCKSDVIALFNFYIKNMESANVKTTLCEMFELPINNIAKSNASLTAKVLNANNKWFTDKFPDFDKNNEDCIRKLNDFATFNFPRFPNLRMGKYTHIFEWFNKIDCDKLDVYKQKLETEVYGVKHTYAWGGLHGAVPNCNIKCDDKHIIINADVTSYYPSLMLNYNFLSQSVAEKDRAKYKQIYNDRLMYKKQSDKAKANALKLVLNTTYGAMKLSTNKLYDPKNANNICVYGQLFLTDLIDKIENKYADTVKLLQSNTDGVMFLIPIDIKDEFIAICEEWSSRTKLGLEYSYGTKLVQKDVNNYYYQDIDGNVKTKGSCFPSKTIIKSNEASKKCTLEFFKTFDINNDVDYDTILKWTNDYFINCDLKPLDYQVIVKSGHTFDYTVSYNQLKCVLETLQNVNRVFLTSYTSPLANNIYKVKPNVECKMGEISTVVFAVCEHLKLIPTTTNVVRSEWQAVNVFNNALTYYTAEQIMSVVDKSRYAEISANNICDFLNVSYTSETDVRQKISKVESKQITGQLSLLNPDIANVEIVDYTKLPPQLPTLDQTVELIEEPTPEDNLNVDDININYTVDNSPSTFDNFQFVGQVKSSNVDENSIIYKFFEKLFKKLESNVKFEHKPSDLNLDVEYNCLKTPTWLRKCQVSTTTQFSTVSPILQDNKININVAENVYFKLPNNKTLITISKSDLPILICCLQTFKYSLNTDYNYAFTGSNKALVFVECGQTAVLEKHLESILPCGIKATIQIATKHAIPVCLKHKRHHLTWGGTGYISECMANIRNLKPIKDHKKLLISPTVRLSKLSTPFTVIGMQKIGRIHTHCPETASKYITALRNHRLPALDIAHLLKFYNEMFNLKFNESDMDDIIESPEINGLAGAFFKNGKCQHGELANFVKSTYLCHKDELGQIEIYCSYQADSQSEQVGRVEIMEEKYYPSQFCLFYILQQIDTRITPLDTRKVEEFLSYLIGNYQKHHTNIKDYFPRYIRLNSTLLDRTALDKGQTLVKDSDPTVYTKLQIDADIIQKHEIDDRFRATASKFLLFLKDLAPPFETIEQQSKFRDLLMQIIAYPLIRGQDIPKAVILLGRGRNGKSTFMNVIRAIYKECPICDLPIRATNEKFTVINFENKCLNLCTELHSDHLKQTDVFKKLLSCEEVFGERKGIDGHLFRTECKQYFATNNMPTFNDRSEGLYDRLMIVPFLNQFERGSVTGTNADLDLSSYGISVILTLALATITKTVQAYGKFKFIDFEVDVVKQNTNQYKLDQDNILSFYSDVYQCTPQLIENTIVKDLYTNYAFYCQEFGYKKVAQNHFTTKMSAMTNLVVTSNREYGALVRRFSKTWIPPYSSKTSGGGNLE